ncbi:hypothetical protein F2Q68_00033182 [Brassica cretica]|uniref:Uncharacterized protein n=1 Tax=Brassica cretica TaxID=69181 RepID=A0A8S9G777_BRACR|nr:hypothetical protein F2Q68_00033182 [Brassica cretica]
MPHLTRGVTRSVRSVSSRRAPVTLDEMKRLLWKPVVCIDNKDLCVSSFRHLKETTYQRFDRLVRNPITWIVVGVVFVGGDYREYKREYERDTLIRETHELARDARDAREAGESKFEFSYGFSHRMEKLDCEVKISDHGNTEDKTKKDLNSTRCSRMPLGTHQPRKLVWDGSWTMGSRHPNTQRHAHQYNQEEDEKAWDFGVLRDIYHLSTAFKIHFLFLCRIPWHVEGLGHIPRLTRLEWSVIKSLNFLMDFLIGWSDKTARLKYQTMETLKHSEGPAEEGDKQCDRSGPKLVSPVY